MYMVDNLSKVYLQYNHLKSIVVSQASINNINLEL